ncbi:MAG: hypothetical protein WBV63_07865, partial [Candidatus Sulfotelmatobacter sp.]
PQGRGGQRKQKKHSQLLPNSCWIDVSRCISDSGGHEREKSRRKNAVKKAGTKAGPGIELAGCPDKI